jgi:nucleotide-binding universal stress UspA family protein
MTVLLTYDGSENAKAAIEHAGAVLQHGPAVVATAWTTFEGAAPAALLALPGDMVREGTAALDEAGRETAEGMAAEGAELARAAGFEAEPRAVVSSGPFFAALIDLADELDASVIVAGSRGRSALRAAVLGSVSTGLLHHTRRPVMIVRDGAD